MTTSSLSSGDSTQETAQDAPQTGEQDGDGGTEGSDPENAAEGDLDALATPGTDAVYKNGVEVRSGTLPDGTKSPSPKPVSGHKVAAPKGRILKEGEEITFDADVKDNYAVVTEDVYQEVTARGSARKTYRLVYTKGTHVPLTAVERKQKEEA